MDLSEKTRVTTLTTARLVLRPVVDDDAFMICAVMRDPAVVRWLPHIPQPYSMEDADAFIARAKTYCVRAIEKDGVLIGMIELDEELGYWLARDYWGQGLMSEAVHAVLAEYFRHPGVSPARSSHMAGNLASKAVLQKAGFGYCGAAQPTTTATGEVVHCLPMVLTPEQWHCMNQVIIQTERLELRPLTVNDIPQLISAIGIQEVAKNLMSVGAPWAYVEAERWIERGRWRGQLGFRFGVFVQGQLVGVVGMGGAPVSVAYGFAPASWGKGYATEAMRALISRMRETFRLTNLHADYFADNPASGAVLRKLGFTEIGKSTGTSLARDGEHPTICCRLDFNSPKL